MAKTCLIAKHLAPKKFKVRDYNRCHICGRPRAYIRRFEICRICFRNLAGQGKIPGLIKSSW